MTDSINSALLAATTKSVKVLQNMQTKQETMIDVINTIAREQKTQGDMLKDIQTKPEPEIFSDIKDIVTDLSKAFATIDLVGLEKAINAQTQHVVEQSELSLVSRIDSAKDEVIDHSNKNTHKVVGTVQTTDKSLSDKVDDLNTAVSNAHDAEMVELKDIKHSGQIETLRKLIAGLKAQRNNLDKLADYIEILSENVQKNRKDVSSSVYSLVETIQDSNARTKSMDLRLSTITGEDTDDGDDLAQSLELLERFDKQHNNISPIAKVPDVANPELDELNSIVQTLGKE